MLPRPPTAPKRGRDAFKMGCPFCGASTSTVKRSCGLSSSDSVARTRRCYECGQTFPTSERLNRVLLHLELVARGIQLLAPLEVIPPPATWENVALLLHRLKDESFAGDYVESTWANLETLLATLRVRV